MIWAVSILFLLCVFFIHKMREFNNYVKISVSKRNSKDFISHAMGSLGIKSLKVESPSKSFTIGEGSFKYVYELNHIKVSCNKKVNFELMELFCLDLCSIFDKEQMESSLETSAKLSALGEMAAGIAHEINNPLAIVHGKANILSALLEDNLEENKDILVKTSKDIIDTVERIDKIISSLRYFVRDDKRNPLSDSSLKEILDTVQVLSIDRCRKEKISLIIEPVDKDLSIYCKPTQISQVLLNLISNSIDAIKEQENARWIKVKTISSLEETTLEVSDSGSGISKEVGQEILNAFYTTKKFNKNAGLGLGLNIARRIVEAHFGSISIDYERENTTFVIKIPHKKEAAVA